MPAELTPPTAEETDPVRALRYRLEDYLRRPFASRCGCRESSALAGIASGLLAAADQLLVRDRHHLARLDRIRELTEGTTSVGVSDPEAWGLAASVLAVVDGPPLPPLPCGAEDGTR